MFVDSDSKNGALGPRFRRTRPGPELELIESFIRVMPLQIPRGCIATVFREPGIESGFPDLVIVVWREKITFRWRPERKFLQTQDFRLLHFLHHNGRASQDEIVAWFGRRAIASIQRLHDSAMIRCVRSWWAPRALQTSFAAAKIIAVEAKVGKWRKVLNQALLNTWFASRSYVLVPNLPSEPQLAAAKALGIGVCSFCNGEVREIAAESSELPKSYASWMFNEWAWRSSHHGVRETSA